MSINNISACYNKLVEATNDVTSALTQGRKMPTDDFADAINAASNIPSLSTDVIMNVNAESYVNKTRKFLVNNLY